MMHCPLCGKEYPPEYRFCRDDATPLQAALPTGAEAGDGAAEVAPEARPAVRAWAVPVLVGVVLLAVGGYALTQRGAPRAEGTASQAAGVSVSGVASALSWRREVCAEAGCSLEIPAGWSGGRMDSGNADLVRWRFTEPGSEWVSVTVDVDVKRAGTPALRVWEDLDGRFARAFGERYRRESLGEATLGGRPAALWTFSIQRKNQPWLRKVDYGVTLPDGRGLALLLTAPPEDFERVRPLFDAVLERFAWAETGSE